VHLRVGRDRRGFCGRHRVHNDEVAVLKAAAARVREALQHLGELAGERDDQLLAEAGAILLELSQQERMRPLPSRTVSRLTAASPRRCWPGFNGDGGDVFFAQVGTVAACVE
jgi:hypothetical protein